jgi:hypothetical protein
MAHTHVSAHARGHTFTDAAAKRDEITAPIMLRETANMLRRNGFNVYLNDYNFYAEHRETGVHVSIPTRNGVFGRAEVQTGASTNTKISFIKKHIQAEQDAINAAEYYHARRGFK